MKKNKKMNGQNMLFQRLCQRSQKDLKKFVEACLYATHDTVITDEGYVFAQGKFPVLLVAHLDTVHKKLPNVIRYDKTQQSLSSPDGIGGDDRCGVYMVLEVVKKYNCSVLFCEDEEIGGVGARLFTEAPFASSLEFNYIIEFDRKGSNDAVFYDCDNPEFEEFITKEHFKSAYGTFSDISILAPFLKCAAVNLSCGYYNAHTTLEYVVLPEMEKNIEEACKILDRTTDDDKFEYIEADYGYGYGRYGVGYKYLNSGWYDSYDDDENYYMIEYEDEFGKTQWVEEWANSSKEAIGSFLIAHPTISYSNVIYVYAEKENNLGYR